MKVWFTVACFGTLFNVAGILRVVPLDKIGYFLYKRRNNIATEDLDQVFALVEKHGSELVGMLLFLVSHAYNHLEEMALR